MLDQIFEVRALMFVLMSAGLKDGFDGSKNKTEEASSLLDGFGVAHGVKVKF